MRMRQTLDQEKLEVGKMNSRKNNISKFKISRKQSSQVRL